MGNMINAFIHEKVKKERYNLMAHKISNDGFNLFLIINEVLIKIKQTPLEKSKCSKCFNPRFHLIKFACCNKFICEYCLDDFQIAKLNCESCKNRWKIKPLWIANISPQNKSIGRYVPCPGVRAKYINKIANSTLQYIISTYIENFENIFWAPFYFWFVNSTISNLNFRLTPDPNLPTHLQKKRNKSLFKVRGTMWWKGGNILWGLFEAKIFNLIANYFLLQYVNNFIQNFGNTFWIPFNFCFVGEIVEQMNFDMIPNTNLSTKVQENIDKSFKGIFKMIITWVSLLVGLFLGNYFCEDSLMVITFFISLATWYGCIACRRMTHFSVNHVIQYDFL